MKKIAIICSLLLFLFATACTKNNNAIPKEVSTSFVTSYFTIDAETLDNYFKINSGANADSVTDIESFHSKFKETMTETGYKELLNNRTYYQDVGNAAKYNVTVSPEKITLVEEETSDNNIQFNFEVKLAAKYTSTGEIKNGTADTSILNQKMDIGGKFSQNNFISKF